MFRTFFLLEPPFDCPSGVWHGMLPSLRQPARCDNLDIAGEGNKTSINLDKILGAASNYYVDSLTPVTNHST